MAPASRESPKRMRTRRAVRGACRDLMAEGGLAAATMRAVAARAGVSVGTVYNHFETKGELIADVTSRIASLVFDEVDRIIDREGTAAERLRAAIEAVAAASLAEPRLAWALIAEPAAPVIEAERLGYRRRAVSSIARLLDSGVRAGELPAQDTTVSATAIVGVVGEVLNRPPAPGGLPEADRSALVEDTVAFCLRGAAAGSGT